MLKILLVSLFASVAFALSDKCDKATEICRHDDDGKIRTMMPETEEELDEYCEYMLKYFECLVKVKSECGSTDDIRERLRIPVFKHICNKENDLYRKLLLVLPCIKREIVEKKGWHCYTMFSNEQPRKKFEEILLSAGLSDIGSEHECFYDYFFDVCRIAEYGAICGIVAREVALEIEGLNNEVTEDECTNKIEAKLPEIAAEMELLYLETEGIFEDPDYMVED